MEEKIFVSIASYRDDECSLTLQSLFNNAKNWNRCFAGICQQNNKSDDDCLINIDNKFKTNIRIIRISYKEAKGPTYARFLCSSLWDGEEYYFQIDSHTTFSKDWDEKLINMIKEIKEKKLSLKPVISHYPIDKENINKNESEVPHIETAEYDSNGILKLSAAIYKNTNNQYLKSCYMSAGMFFCESSFLNEIPFDPTLDYLFMGEEILTTVRFYTYGWDVFTPKENVIYHEYVRKDKPKYHDDNKDKFDNKKAIEKVKQILNNNKNNKNNKNEIHDNDDYGLGKVRTLDDFYKNCKIINNENDKNNENKKINIYLILFLSFSLFSLLFYLFYLYK